MKDTIKIVIALAFILGSYLLGNHQEDEKYQSKIEEFEKNIRIEKKNNSSLTDSNVKLRRLIDSLQTIAIKQHVTSKNAKRIRLQKRPS